MVQQIRSSRACWLATRGPRRIDRCRFDNSGEPNLFVTTPASNDVDSLIAKIDHSFNNDNQLTGRYFFGTSDQSFPLAILAGNILPGSTRRRLPVHLVSISYLKILSPTKVNELRFGYNRFDEGFFPEDNDFDPPRLGSTPASPTSATLAYRRFAFRMIWESRTSAPRCLCRAHASTATSTSSITSRGSYRNMI